MKKLSLVSVLGILFFFVCIQFYPLLLGKTLVFGDNFSLMVPGKIFTVEWIKNGVLPLWNPYIFSGLPWIQDINQSVLYPSTILFLIFSPAVALNATILIHVVFTGLGAWMLAKKWISNPWLQLIPSILWAFSTQVTGSIHNLSTIQSITWLPWIILFGLSVTNSNTAKVLFGVAVLFQFLGGYPQHVVYAIFATMLISVFMLKQKEKSRKPPRKLVKQWLLTWIFVGLVSLGTSAVAWLPFSEVLMNSTRMAQSTSQAQVGSLNPPMLAKVVLPYIFDKPTAGMKWGPAWSGQPNMVFYVTLLGLLIVVLRLRSKKLLQIEKLFLIFIPASIVFAFGSALPGFAVIQELLPFFRIGRYPSMILIVSSLFLALWVGIALEKVAVSARFLKKLLLLSAGILVVSVGACVVLKTNYSEAWQFADSLLQHKLSSSAFHTLERDRIISSVIVLNTLSVLLFLFLASISLWKQSYRLLVLVLALDMIVHTHSNFQFAPNSAYALQENALAEGISNIRLGQSWQYRWLTRGSNRPYSDFGTYWEAMVVRQPFSDSFVDTKELRDFSKLSNLRDGFVPNWNMVGDLPLVHGYTTLVPQDYAQLWQTPDSETRINFLDEINPVSSELLRAWSAKYYLVDTSYAIQEDLSPLSEVQKIANWQILSVPGVLPRIRYTDGTMAQVKEYDENPNQISFSVTTELARELVIADRYDKDWRATVNGKSVEVKDTQGMRSIRLEQGTNEIRMWYSPTLFYLGLVISSITGASMLIWLFLTKK